MAPHENKEATLKRGPIYNSIIIAAMAFAYGKNLLELQQDLFLDLL